MLINNTGFQNKCSFFYFWVTILMSIHTKCDMTKRRKMLFILRSIKVKRKLGVMGNTVLDWRSESQQWDGVSL